MSLHIRSFFLPGAILSTMLIVLSACNLRLVGIDMQGQAQPEPVADVEFSAPLYCSGEAVEIHWWGGTEPNDCAPGSGDPSRCKQASLRVSPSSVAGFDGYDPSYINGIKSFRLGPDIPAVFAQYRVCVGDNCALDTAITGPYPSEGFQYWQSFDIACDPATMTWQWRPSQRVANYCVNGQCGNIPIDSMDSCVATTGATTGLDGMQGVYHVNASLPDGTVFNPANGSISPDSGAGFQPSDFSLSVVRSGRDTPPPYDHLLGRSCSPNDPPPSVTYQGTYQPIWVSWVMTCQPPQQIRDPQASTSCANRAADTIPLCTGSSCQVAAPWLSGGSASTLQGETPIPLDSTLVPVETGCPAGTYYAEGTGQCIPIQVKTQKSGSSSGTGCSSQHSQSSCTNAGCTWDPVGMKCSELP